MGGEVMPRYIPDPVALLEGQELIRVKKKFMRTHAADMFDMFRAILKDHERRISKLEDKWTPLESEDAE